MGVDDGLFGVVVEEFCAGPGGAGVGEFAEFGEFEEVEDLLGFADAALAEEEVGEGAVGVGDGVGVGFLDFAFKAGEVAANVFVGVDGLFVEDDCQFWLLLLNLEGSEVGEGLGLGGSIADFLGKG